MVPLNKKPVKQIINSNLFLLSYIYRYERFYTITYLLLQIGLTIGQVMGNVLLCKVVIDAVQYSQKVDKVFIFCFAVIGFNILLSIINAFFEEKYTLVVRERVGKRMRLEVYRKAIEVDLVNYDNPDFYDRLVWVVEQSDSKAFDVLVTTGQFLQSIVAIAGLITIIIVIEPLGTLFVTVSFIIDLLINLKTNKVYYNREVEKNHIERRRDYISRIFYLPDYAKELRLSNIKKVLLRDYSTSSSKLRELLKRDGIHLALYKFIQGYFGKTLLLDTIYLGILTYKALILKSISLGTITAIVNGILSFKNFLNGISLAFTRYVQYSYYIEHFRELMESERKAYISNKKISAMADKSEVIEFENVNFSYKKGECVLRDINLKIHGGEKVAIVGYNGAGKTTLIKLLLRLYETEGGIIKYAGIDIKDYEIDEYRNCYGIIFQDYQIYSATLGENVVMDGVDSYSEGKAVNTLDMVGFAEKLRQLPLGINTIMLKEFDERGVLLSGGESQKVAIARAFFRRSPVVILDEASSNMDPISEFNFNNYVINETPGKTVVFISHRLSTTRMADRIVMLDGGRIIEVGTHEELMQLNGKYAQMFKVQAAKYQVVV